MLSGFRLGLLGKYLCFAMVAVGIGLAWGRGGMLTLGQGVFFGLGAYAMAMHLKLADAGPGKRARLHGADLVERAAGLVGAVPPAPVTLVAIVVLPAAGGRACSGWRRSAGGCAGPTSPSCPRRWPRRSPSC